MFHVTSQRWRNRVVLHPMESSDSRIRNRSGDEPYIARTCVAPTISGCFAAIPIGDDGESPNQTFYVFRTARTVTTKKPYDVYDQKITGERWITKPCVFYKILAVPKHIIKGMPYCDGCSEEDQEFYMATIRHMLLNSAKELRYYGSKTFSDVRQFF